MPVALCPVTLIAAGLNHIGLKPGQIRAFIVDLLNCWRQLFIGSRAFSRFGFCINSKTVVVVLRCNDV